ATDFDADVVLVMLGVNDTCGPPRGNWALAPSFLADARDLLRFLKRPGNQVAVGLPSTMFPNLDGLNPERRADLAARSPRLMQVREWLMKAAQFEGVRVVDIDRVLAPDRKLVTDGVHPTAEGYSRIAELFRDAVANLESVPETAIPRR
ncbi:MAG: SGNH/GDSL hydrolase family protein, partial [Verrucomicrobiales bacterium]